MAQPFDPISPRGARIRALRLQALAAVLERRARLLPAKCARLLALARRLRIGAAWLNRKATEKPQD